MLSALLPIIVMAQQFTVARGTMRTHARTLASIERLCCCKGNAMAWTRRRWVKSVLVAGAVPPLSAMAADGDIVVGQIGPFTGIPVPDAPQLNQGIKACFA